jgi:CRISPR-associated protein (TIGR03984 family)
MTQTTLYGYRSENVTLEEAIANCGDVLEGAIALLYSPDSCKFLRFKDGAFEYASEKEKKHHKLGDVFEARIFTEDTKDAKGSELRWLNYIHGEGSAVLLSEAQQSVTNFKLIESKSCEALPQQYLLWGQKASQNPQSGWQRLAEARIGKLDIPFKEELKDGQRIYLKTYEYMAEWIYQEGDKEIGGNYTIIEERLVRLEGT